MKLIFLDIDGVMNNDETFERKKNAKKVTEIICRESCRRLQTVIDATGAKIVVSSAWRSRELEEFSACLFIDRHHFIGRTPWLRRRSHFFVVKGEKCQGWSSERRGTEIATWLANNPDVAREVTRFVILDDEADMEPLMEHLVQTDFMTGLTEERAAEVVWRLNH